MDQPVIEVGTGIDVAQRPESMTRDIDRVGAVGVEARCHLRMGVPLEHRSPNTAAGERDRRNQRCGTATYECDVRCFIHLNFGAYASSKCSYTL